MLRFCIAAVGASLIASAAAAAPPPCDYYQNLLMGSLCQGTADVGLAINVDQREITNTFNFPGFQETDKSRVNFLSATAVAAITPLSWLKIAISSDLTTQTNKFISTGSSSFFGPFSFSSSSRQTYASFQTLGALANLLDTTSGDSRYVINVFLTAGFVPGTDVGDNPGQQNARWQTEWIGGAEANASWRLPESDYAIVAMTEVRFAHVEPLAITVMQPSLSVLLSNDLWGIAVGPSVHANILLSRDGGVGSSPVSTFLGGQIRAQPFRMVTVPFLHDLTATLAAYHSIGQANWVDTGFGRSSSVIVDASLSWHFQY